MAEVGVTGLVAGHRLVKLMADHIRRIEELVRENEDAAEAIAKRDESIVLSRDEVTAMEAAYRASAPYLPPAWMLISD